MQIAHFDTFIPHPPWVSEFNKAELGPMPSSPAKPDGLRHQRMLGIF
jgi:hypothetical protein